jgi:hypothetical protein
MIRVLQPVLVLVLHQVQALVPVRNVRRYRRQMVHDFDGMRVRGHLRGRRHRLCLFAAVDVHGYILDGGRCQIRNGSAAGGGRKRDLCGVMPASRGERQQRQAGRGPICPIPIQSSHRYSSQFLLRQGATPVASAARLLPPVGDREARWIHAQPDGVLHDIPVGQRGLVFK